LLFTLSGKSAGDDFGLGVTFAGDIDCDGFDDIAVSADLTDTGGSNSGTVYVYSGQNLELRSNRHTTLVR
jgi:hypothetical protein